jgi:Xaa-Pro aminopeptidase
MTDRYAQRRQRVLQELTHGGVLVLAAAPELMVGRDTHLRYVVDAELYYLTGYTEPDAVLVLDPASETPFTMFVRPRDAEHELWHGRRGGLEGAQERFGAQAVFPIGELGERLPRMLAKADTVYARFGSRPQLDGILQQVLTNGRATRARTGHGPHSLREPGDILDGMRLLKDDGEIALIREAARISAEAFLETLPRVRPGLRESEIDALLEYGFRLRGASGPAFTTITATGGNATVLHYVENSATLGAGDLLLIDAGARYQMYCADISRTVPVSGRFSGRQRDLYDVVLAAHDAALAACQPGAPVDGIHAAARATLARGLASAGLLQESQLEEEAAIKAVFPHRTSHWLGLEVHDVGAYAQADQQVLLQPGMVLTIEPGVYLPGESLGIRIEDDVLITPSGHEVLTAQLPTRADELERLLA